MDILVVSDIESKYIWDHFERDAFRDVKLILACGDLSAQYLSFLVTMLPCPLYYVPGNHDKRYLTAPPLGCVDIDGKLVIWNGLRILGFGGCKSPRGLVYEYTDKQMEHKVHRMESSIRRAGGIDLLITHAPALGLGDGPDSFHEGFSAFRYLDETYQPAYHFYGHVHSSSSPVDRRAFRQFGATTLVNTTGYKLIHLQDDLAERQRVLPPRRLFPRRESE